VSRAAIEVLRWAPRIFTLAIAAFFAAFSVGAAMHMHSIVDGIMHFAPALLVLAAVAAGWRRPQIGAVLLTFYAVVYAVTTRTRLDWVLVIAGPLVLGAALYGLHWLALRRAPPRRGGG
jgi:hypothetical protein